MLTNVDALAKWIAGHRPAAARLTAVLADNSEQAIATPAGAHKWKKTALLAFNMHAVEVRLYDAAGALIGCEGIGSEEDDAEAASPASPLPTLPLPASVPAGDVSAVAAALASAFVQVVRDTAAAQADVHKEAFKQLSDVAKIANNSAKEANEAAREAKLQLESYIARRERELEEREAEVEEKGATAGMLQGLMQNPDALKMVQQFFAGKVLPAKPTPPAGTNGAAQ